MQNMQLEGNALRSATSEPMQAGGLRENYCRPRHGTLQGRLVSSDRWQPHHLSKRGSLSAVFNPCVLLHDAVLFR